MFTGLITGRGTIRRIEARDGAIRFRVESEWIAPKFVLGESISVNGACMTVVEFHEADSGFSFEASQESLAVTTLSHLRLGDRVHLERALHLGDSMGGHLVTGHIDGIGSLASRSEEGSCLRLDLSVAASLLRYFIPKGSVSIDGVSLTVNTIDDEHGTFSVMLIPHTLSLTHFAQLVVGDSVNIEVDLLGKYVERLLGPRV